MPPPLKILVADDDPNTRLLMQASLSKIGLDVTLAGDGAEAVRLYRIGHHDLVMLDMDMPGMDGRDACAALRAEAGPLLPIVMVTGMDDLSSIERAYESGATDFIAKPINWALLGHRVRYLLRAYQNLLDLRTAEARNAAVLSAIPDQLFEMDAQGRCLSASRTGAAPAPGEDWSGRTVDEVLPPAAAQAFRAALLAARENGASTGRQYELPGAEASRWYELSVARKAAFDAAEPGFIVLSRDITERKEAEMRIARLAYVDSLTGLPNRQAFLDRVEREIRRAQRNEQRIALLFMDLDGFKNVNDTMGHSAGDQLLQWAAERLLQGLRPSDLVAHTTRLPEGDGELSRLGGDEFAALILDVAGAEDALRVAQRIGELMRRPFTLYDRTVTLTVSTGIAIFPDDGSDSATLFQHADTAMYHAKRAGRDNAQIYSYALTEEAMRRLELNTSLRAAIEREEFTLVYQPQIDLATGRLHAVEALIRWNHPVRGLLGPLDFITIAEEFGLIIGIGRWVLLTACTAAAAWVRAGHRIGVAVNLSPMQFNDPGLVMSVIDILDRTGLPPELLELEITESSLMENSSETISRLHDLRAHGVRIALDDFGTGYSSLGYLTRMPIGHLKVDRCFVSGEGAGDRASARRQGQDADRCAENLAIIRAVLAMAASLGMRVTAEGVETLEQARRLRAMDCHYGQGYYFSRPVPREMVLALIARDWALDLAQPADPSSQTCPSGAS